ncbi:MAG: hypothetical protein VCA35_11410, partial [Roseibacillus sp.]
MPADAAPNSTDPSDPGSSAESEEEMVARLISLSDQLELIAADRAVLEGLSLEERTRLLTAAGSVFCPDVAERRRFTRARRREYKASKIQADQEVLNETGIRTLRSKTVFTTPNVYPPQNFSEEEIEDDPDFREVVEPQNCYICKTDYSRIHHFYDQLCPECAEFNFGKRT